MIGRISLGLAAPAAGPVARCQGRVVAATLSLPGDREIGLMSVYLRDGEGLSVGNGNIMEEIAEDISGFRRSGLQVIVGGVWNMTPAELDANEWCSDCGVGVRGGPPALGTCRRAQGPARMLDFFVCSDGADAMVQEVVTQTGADTFPHWPVRLVCYPDAQAFRSLQFVSPPALPIEAVFGPRPCPPSYREAAHLARRYRQKINERSSAREARRAGYQAYSAWARAAETELEGITGVNLDKHGRRSGIPKVKFQDALPPGPVSMTRHSRTRGAESGLPGRCSTWWKS